MNLNTKQKKTYRLKNKLLIAEGKGMYTLLYLK